MWQVVKRVMRWQRGGKMTFSDRPHFSNMKCHHWKRQLSLLTSPIQNCDTANNTSGRFCIYLFIYLQPAWQNTFTWIIGRSCPNWLIDWSILHTFGDSSKEIEKCKIVMLVNLRGCRLGYTLLAADDIALPRCTCCMQLRLSSNTALWHANRCSVFALFVFLSWSRVHVVISFCDSWEQQIQNCL